MCPSILFNQEKFKKEMTKKVDEIYEKIKKKN
jgi:hypothetical protein